MEGFAVKRMYASVQRNYEKFTVVNNKNYPFYWVEIAFVVDGEDSLREGFLKMYTRASVYEQIPIKFSLSFRFISEFDGKPLNEDAIRADEFFPIKIEED